MDLRDILIGCVVRVETKREGVELLNSDKNVAGVVWKDPVEDLPELTAEQRIILSQCHIVWHHEEGLSFSYGNHESLPFPSGAIMKSLKPYFDLAVKDVLIANEFKSDIERRKHWFLIGLGNDTQHHQDLKAQNIWLHRHLTGGGLKLVFPTENKKALILRVGPHENRVVRAGALRGAFESGLLSSLELEPNEVAAFNENMLHISHADKNRLRTTVNGFARI